MVRDSSARLRRSHIVKTLFMMRERAWAPIFVRWRRQSRAVSRWVVLSRTIIPQAAGCCATFKLSTILGTCYKSVQQLVMHCLKVGTGV